MIALVIACQVPGASWNAARVEADLALSKELMLKLDAEKGIEANPLEAGAAAKGISLLGFLICSSSLIHHCVAYQATAHTLPTETLHSAMIIMASVLYTPSEYPLETF